jgi:triosephosphate isomerase (TIM)
MSVGRSAGTGSAGGIGGVPSGARGRRRIVAGNWKMHLLAAEAAAFCRELRLGLAAGTADRSAADRPEVILFPSFPLLPAVVRELAGSGVGVGAQDLHPADRGAHTGDVSGPQLVDAGCGWALCGHSERRRDHAESDELVGRKVAAAARHGLTPLLCVGETREQRESGETLAVLERQVSGGLAPLPPPPLPGSPEGAERAVGAPHEEHRGRGLVIAYEPVWAIGTGLTASPETAQEAHRFLRATVARLTGEDPEAVTLLYGGSVTAANAAGLIAQPASLDPRQFLAIIACSG